MVRKQLYIDEDIEAGLEALAARTGRSQAHHVRSALRAYLQAEQARLSGDREPLMDLIGLVEDQAGPDDVAASHDRYLYGAGTAK